MTSAIYVAVTKKHDVESSIRTEEDCTLEEGLLQNVDDDTKAPGSESMPLGSEHVIERRANSDSRLGDIINY